MSGDVCVLGPFCMWWKIENIHADLALLVWGPAHTQYPRSSAPLNSHPPSYLTLPSPFLFSLPLFVLFFGVFFFCLRVELESILLLASHAQMTLIDKYIYIYIYMYMYMYMYVYIYIYIHIYIYAYMCIHIYAHTPNMYDMYICTYIYI